MKSFTKKQILNEIMGVPKAIDIWVEIFTNATIYGIEKIIDNDRWQDNEGSDVIESHTLLKWGELEELILKGFNVSSGKELLENEEFKKLPIWKPQIFIEVVAPPQENITDGSDLYDLIEKSGAGFNGGMGFGHNRPTLFKMKEVPTKVLPNLHTQIEILVKKEELPNLPESTIKLVRKNVRSLFSHELTHTYQHYMTLIHGGDSGFGEEEALNMMLNTIRSGPPLPKSMSDFLHTLYLHLSFENNARVAQVYYVLKEKGVNTKEEFIKEIKKTGIWEAYERMKSFEAKEFLENFEVSTGGDSIMDLLNDLRNAIDNKGKEQIIKDMVRIWQLVLDNVRAELQRGGMDLDNMEDVPKSAMKNPYNFFKFWEKRFHKNAENYRRKLLRIGSLLVK
jgi:hypothetical protein